MTQTGNSVSRILKLVSLEKKDISQIYFFAILYGIIMLVIPLGIQALISFAQTNAISTSVVLLILFIVLSVIISGILQINQMRIIERIQQKIFVRYGFGFARKIPALNLATTGAYYLPELVNRFFDVLTLQKKLAKLLLDFPLAIVQILFGLILLAFYHPVFITFSIVLVTVVFCILFFSGKRGLTTSIQESTYKYKVVAWLEEVARVIYPVKFARSPDFVIRKTDDNITRYLHYRTEHFKVLLLQYKTLVGFKVLVTGTMLAVGVFLMIAQQLTVGQFIAAEIVILSVMSSVEKLIINLDSVYDVLTAVEKIEQITDKENETSGTENINPVLNRGLSVDISNLTFAYPDEHPILKGLSVRASPGDKICVTGDDGSGKSTLLRLLGGIYTNYGGNILVNNIPIKNYSLRGLRTHIGMMSGTSDIFEGTLLENLTMGVVDVDKQRLLQLCNNIGLADFINMLTDGLATKLLAGGQNLPSTAVQKILLVRALINEPPLLLLDEPWRGLGLEQQQHLQHVILHEMPNTTAFIVSSDKAFSQKCSYTLNISHHN